MATALLALSAALLAVATACGVATAVRRREGRGSAVMAALTGAALLAGLAATLIAANHS